MASANVLSIVSLLIAMLIIRPFPAELIYQPWIRHPTHHFWRSICPTKPNNDCLKDSSSQSAGSGIPNLIQAADCNLMLKWNITVLLGILVPLLIFLLCPFHVETKLDFGTFSLFQIPLNPHQHETLSSNTNCTSCSSFINDVLHR